MVLADRSDTFGLIKTKIDAHTMGLRAASSLLCECGYRVVIAPAAIEYAMERISVESYQHIILDWINNNSITRLGFSYRLDPEMAVELFGRLVHLLKDNGYLDEPNPRVRSLFFAGIKPACEKIEEIYKGIFTTFCGGESTEETLLAMGIPVEDIPQTIKDGCQYDKELAKFANGIIDSGEYLLENPSTNVKYPEFGTKSDSLALRLEYYNANGLGPVIRAHSGPYSDSKSREECLAEYNIWCKELAREGLLDVLSIGSSQLSQSNFGEKWGDKLNGGGVPVNSFKEYEDIWKASRPMLVRTYSGTSRVRELAEIYEKSINIAWHALSLWWFDELDGRGPNCLYDNLCEHIDAIRYISTTNKPVETNVSHHFAFRGADDITYIVSGFLAAKTAKEYGTKSFVLQNMLNTPRSTWGIQDLAKSRTLLKLIKELEDDSFRVMLQTRAGLDLFKPDIDQAKIQLAAVTALMDDIVPDSIENPDIIHVVSYSEALFLADPKVLNDSIRITKTALRKYRDLKSKGLTPDVLNAEIVNRQIELETACRKIISAMEETIPCLYTPKGLYLAFVAGWLPVPELWSESEEFAFAKSWGSRMNKGGVVLCDQDIIVSTDHRINRCVSNLPEAEYIFSHKYTNGSII